MSELPHRWTVMLAVCVLVWFLMPLTTGRLVSYDKRADWQYRRMWSWKRGPLNTTCVKENQPCGKYSDKDEILPCCDSRNCTMGICKNFSLIEILNKYVNHTHTSIKPIDDRR